MVRAPVLLLGNAMSLRCQSTQAHSAVLISVERAPVSNSSNNALPASLLIWPVDDSSDIASCTAVISASSRNRWRGSSLNLRTSLHGLATSSRHSTASGKFNNRDNNPSMRLAWYGLAARPLCSRSASARLMSRTLIEPSLGLISLVHR